MLLFFIKMSITNMQVFLVISKFFFLVIGKMTNIISNNDKSKGGIISEKESDKKNRLTKDVKI